MADIVSPQKRSEMMSGIKGKNTKPEIKIRKALHAKGYRYRIHVQNIIGKPDIVLPKYNALIFIHGCFWHLHNCHLFKWPSTRTDFWYKKIYGNKKKDLENKQKLLDSGWRLLIIWECSIKGKGKLEFNELIKTIQDWLRSDNKFTEIRGETNK